MRNRVLALAGATMMFAAFAFGQAGTPTVVANAQNIRAEGKNEMVGDLVITVRNATASTIPTGTNTWLTVTLSSGTITSASGDRIIKQKS